ncbi:MAG: DNA-binding response regulator [Chitinophagaceae bacterium]|nr:DNA-binding response regulator [Chitinophagaceae bacterium]
MRILNCLIVDDEPIARDILVAYCNYLPSLNIIGVCGNALEAKRLLAELPVDILFLDIHLPVMDGISFFSMLKNPPQVIFTTAFKEYAVNAFDLAACDYLVKPFLMDRFIIAVDKAIARISTTATGQDRANNSPGDDSFFVRTEGKIYKIKFSELLYAEAKGNYTKLVTVNTIVIPNMSLTNLEKLLPVSVFNRVHRSFIVNQTKITHLEGNSVFIGQNEIPVGSNYKEQFFKSLGL